MQVGIRTDRDIWEGVKRESLLHKASLLVEGFAFSLYGLLLEAHAGINVKKFEKVCLLLGTGNRRKPCKITTSFSHAYLYQSVYKILNFTPKMKHLT